HDVRRGTGRPVHQRELGEVVVLLRLDRYQLDGDARVGLLEVGLDVLEQLVGLREVAELLVGDLDGRVVRATSAGAAGTEREGDRRCRDGCDEESCRAHEAPLRRAGPATPPGQLTHTIHPWTAGVKRRTGEIVSAVTQPPGHAPGRVQSS